MTRLSLALALLLVACTDGGLQDDPTATPTGDTSTPTATEPQVMEITVDTTAGAYVDLATGATVDHTPQSAATDAFGWHLFLDGADVFSNGGISGSGLCSLGLLDEPDSDAVEALEALQSPPPSWEADRRFDALGTQWHNYNQATGLFTAVPDVGYLVRGGEGTSYARLRFVAMDFPSRDDLGVKSFEISLEPQPTGADTFTGTPLSFTGSIPGEGGDLCFDVDTDNVVGCTGTAWDVLLGFVGRDFYMRTNSGPAGDGSGGAYGPQSWVNLAPWTSATEDRDGNDITGEYRPEALTSLVIDEPWFTGEGFDPNHRIYGLDTDASDDDAPRFAFQVMGFDGTDLTLRYRRLRDSEG